MPTQLLPLVHKMLGHAVWLVASVGTVLAVDFSSSITLGSILIAALLVVIAGFFTIRSKIADIWREEAEGERAAKERLQEELRIERARHLVFESEQQELRHDLKNELAGCKAQLQVAEAKTDLSIAVEAIKEMNQNGTTVSRAIAEALTRSAAASEARDHQTHQILTEIRDKLPTEPVQMTPAEGVVIPVHEVERRGGEST